MSFSPQLTRNWCWAAAAQMVIGSFGQYPGQCQVASVALFGPQGFNVCCVNPQNCNTPGPSTWIANTVYQYTGRTSSIRGGPLSFQEIKSNIDSCSPIVVLYSGSTVGHFVVIKGYNEANQTLTIYDPIFGVFPNVPYGTSFHYQGGTGVLTWAQTVHHFY